MNMFVLPLSKCTPGPGVWQQSRAEHPDYSEKPAELSCEQPIDGGHGLARKEGQTEEKDRQQYKEADKHPTSSAEDGAHRPEEREDWMPVPAVDGRPIHRCNV